jgi:Bacteriocin-protection, YdeI or OmpD-Associated
MPITVGETLKAPHRAAWREWLAAHHADKREVWLVADDRPEVPTVDYLDAVEEALCFGWIDSIAKRISPTERVQRFSPRRPKSNWTELNKARARRLITLGLMTNAGRATLPDLDAPCVVATDIQQALTAAGGWDFFAATPLLYQRVRAGYVEEQRRVPAEFTKRLTSLVEKCAAGKLFGGWNDGGRLS